MRLRSPDTPVLRDEKPYVTEAFFLAGGLGTRLRSAVHDVPKPMAPVHGRPFLEYLLDWWERQGIRRFTISVGYLGHIVEDYFGASYKKAKIRYVREPAPLGTGGALALACRAKVLRGGTILMLNADTWFPATLPALEAAQLPGTAIAIGLCRISNNTRYGDVCCNVDGRVASFRTATNIEALINAGCYLVHLDILSAYLKNMPEVFSLEDDLFPILLGQGLLSARVLDADFIDIGIPDDYLRFQIYVKQSTGCCSMLLKEQPSSHNTTVDNVL